jgi:hypothetical protein
MSHMKAPAGSLSGSPPRLCRRLIRSLRTRVAAVATHGRRLAHVFVMSVSLAALPPVPSAGPDTPRLPDQPYRYLSSGTSPTSVRQEALVTQSIININTAEWRPQAYLLVQTASLTPLSGAAQIIASLTPVPLPMPGPRNAVPLGNAYDAEIRTRDGQPVKPTGTGANPVVQLRVPNPSMPGHIVLELHHQGGWTALRTIQTADVIYAAELPSFGIVVAVYIPSASLSASASGHVINYEWALLVAGLIIIIAVAGWVALRRGRPPCLHR